MTIYWVAFICWLALGSACTGAFACAAGIAKRARRRAERSAQHEESARRIIEIIRKGGGAK